MPIFYIPLSGNDTENGKIIQLLDDLSILYPDEIILNDCLRVNTDLSAIHPLLQSLSEWQNVSQLAKPEVPTRPVEKKSRKETTQPKGDTRVCLMCGKEFTPARKNSRHCSKSCRNREYLEKKAKEKAAEPTHIAPVVGFVQREKVVSPTEQHLQERIEMVVAQAKQNMPGGSNIEKTTMGYGQTLDCRKLG